MFDIAYRNAQRCATVAFSRTGGGAGVIFGRKGQNPVRKWGFFSRISMLRFLAAVAASQRLTALAPRTVRLLRAANARKDTPGTEDQFMCSPLGDCGAAAKGALREAMLAAGRANFYAGRHSFGSRAIMATSWKTSPLRANSGSSPSRGKDEGRMMNDESKTLRAAETTAQPRHARHLWRPSRHFLRLTVLHWRTARLSYGL